MLIRSLEEGNRHLVTLGNTKVYVEAAPQFMSLNFYDVSQQRIRPGEVRDIGRQVLSQQSLPENSRSHEKEQRKGMGL